MLEYDITKNTYSLINKRLALLQQDKSNLTDLRDDILGNTAIRNTYFQLGLMDVLERCSLKETEVFRIILSSSIEEVDNSSNFNIQDFKQWINQISDDLYSFSASIDCLMTICTTQPSNIEYLLHSPFLSICANFVKTSSSYKTVSKVLTFISYLSFEREFVRKKIVELDLLNYVIQLLQNKNDDIILSACLLLRSVSRSVKLTRTAFDNRCFDTVLSIYVKYTTNYSDHCLEVKRAISAIFCNFAMEHSPFRSV